MKKIVVLFPTFTESKFFSRTDVVIRFSGVGISSAAYSTLKIIIDDKPDIIIMAGIAGVYYGSNLKIGDTVLVRREHEADCGFFTKEGFKHLTELDLDMDFELIEGLDCPYISEDMPFKTAIGNTMNAALAPFVKTKGVDVESMEGYPFFHVCLKENIKFFELRSISNHVDVEDEDWDYDTSLRNMTSELNKLIDYLLE